MRLALIAMGLLMLAMGAALEQGHSLVGVAVEVVALLIIIYNAFPL